MVYRKLIFLYTHQLQNLFFRPDNTLIVLLRQTYTEIHTPGQLLQQTILQPRHTAR